MYSVSLIEKKYPIEGDYISEFEDEDYGTIIVRTAPVHLEQKGSKVTGESIQAYLYNLSEKLVPLRIYSTYSTEIEEVDAKVFVKKSYP